MGTGLKLHSCKPDGIFLHNILLKIPVKGACLVFLSLFLFLHVSVHIEGAEVIDVKVAQRDSTSGTGPACECEVSASSPQY